MAAIPESPNIKAAKPEFLKEIFGGLSISWQWRRSHADRGSQASTPKTSDPKGPSASKSGGLRAKSSGPRGSGHHYSVCVGSHTHPQAVSATAPSEPSACHITAMKAIYELTVPHVMATEAVHKLPVLHITATEAIHACSIMKSVYVSAPLWSPDPPTPPWWCPALLRCSSSPTAPPWWSPSPLATPWPSEPPGVSPLLICPWPRLLPHDPLFHSPCPPLLHDPGHDPGPLSLAWLSIPPPPDFICFTILLDFLCVLGGGSASGAAL